MGRTRHVTRWELDEFIGSRNLHGALVKLHDILASGEEPVGLLSTINLFMKRLFTVKALMVKGVRDPYQVGQALGVPGRIAEKIIRQQQAYSDPELRAAFVHLRDTDYRLKSAAMDRSLLLDHLLCRIIPPGPLSPPTAKRPHARP
jgi:DNA polymerase III delta subunit